MKNLIRREFEEVIRAEELGLLAIDVTRAYREINKKLIEKAYRILKMEIWSWAFYLGNELTHTLYHHPSFTTIAIALTRAKP